jgi:hypothetical protein
MPANNEVKITKVLRIGIIKDHQIIHERLVLPGDVVTIGTSPKNTFQIEDEGLPKSHMLFAVKGNKYALNFTTAMKGIIAAGKGQQVDLETLRKEKRVSVKGQTFVLPLEMNFRGKVTIGDYNFLFQFIQAPPISLRQARLNFNPVLFESDDALFFSVLGLFSMMALTFMIFVMNADPPSPEDQEEAVERFVELLNPPKDDEPPEPDEPLPVDEDMPTREDPNAQPTETAPEPEPDNTPAQEEQKEQAKADKSANMSAADEAAATEEVANTAFMKLLVTRGANSNGTVSSAFGAGDAQSANLDDVLANVSSGEVAGKGNSLGTKGQTDKTGRGNANIGVEKAGKNTRGAGTGSGPKVRGPTGDVKPQTIETALGECGSAIKKTVYKKFHQVKYCYERRLKENPSIRGRVEVAVSIVDGKVRSASIDSNTTGDKSLESCIVKKVKRWKFPADCEDEAVFPFMLNPGN